VRQEEVGDEHRLGAAKVRVRRHQRRPGALGLPGKSADEGHERVLQQRDAAAEVEPQIERHLFVARPPGVQPPPGVADALDQLALDEAVHVLVLSGDPRRVAPSFVEDRRQAGGDGRRVVAGQDAGRLQRIGPREAAGDVVFEQRAIEAERDAEVERGGIGSGVEAAGPERHEWFTSSGWSCGGSTARDPARSASRTV
jgi:hypothetical protein